jgi:RHS repeat-associated protein
VVARQGRRWDRTLRAGYPGGGGRRIAAALSVVLAAGLGAAVQARPAQAAPVQGPTAPVGEPDGPLRRPDEPAALATARLSGKRVLISGRTTETTQFWALPSGAVEAEISAGPVRVRGDDGDWADVDTTLRRNPDGSVTPAAHPYRLKLSGPAGAGEHKLIQLGTGGQQSTLGWSGRLPEPTLNGATATYPEVRPGVDLVVTATRTGYEQTLVVKNRQAAAQVRQIRLPWRTPGTATAAATRARHLPALMWDSRVDRASGERTHRAAVGVRHEGTGAKSTLVLTPDARFLTDRATTYPVVIDPSQSLGPNFDAFVQNTYTTDQSTVTELKLGTHDGGSTKARSFLSFHNLSWLWDKRVTAATLSLWNHHSYSCSARSWEAWQVNPVNNTARWTAQPAWLAKAGTSTETKGFSTSCGAGRVSVPVTLAFQKTAEERWQTSNIGLRATSETDSYSWKRFHSAEGVNPPTVTLTYESKSAVTTQATLPSTVCATGADRPYIASLTPQLRAQVTDADGSSVHATFEWHAVGGALIGSATEGPGASGSWLSTTVPSGAFVEGGTYAWRVRGRDGAEADAWSRWCEFTVDTVAPSASPTVSSTAYPAGQWAGAAGTTGSFTLGAAGVADVAAYEYGLDTNPPNQVVNAAAPGANVTLPLTPAADGPHTLYVRTRDRAGNRSPLRAYAFSVGGGALTGPRTGDITAAKTPITGVGRSTATGVTYQWRRADTDAWVDIPAAHVTVAAGGAKVTWPLPTSGGGEFPKLNWDVAATLAGADAQAVPRDGPLQLRGSFVGGTAAASGAVRITFDRNQATAATEEIGPGTVNLITGDLSVTDTDVSVDAYGSDLTVGRTYHSRRSTQTDAAAMFGPGWVSGAAVEEADAAWTGLTVYGSLVQVGTTDGDTVGFSRRTATVFDPEVGMEPLKLTHTAATDTYTLTDTDDTAVTFTRVAGSAAGRYVPTVTRTPGSEQTTTWSWERVTVAGQEVLRPTRMLAPVPDGVNCATLTRGCRALAFRYATATTATGGTEDTWGDYLGRVKEIAFTAWDPDQATPAMRTVVLARYAYDDAGRLRARWDPRRDRTDGGVVRHQWETYAYQADGVLSTVTPPGQESWRFRYTTVPGDPGAGRLHQVSRSALAAGTATDTVVYRVPVTGGGAPYDLSPAQTARWGQSEVPTDATAVFPADQVPSGNPATGALPSSWERASVTYLDANAREVNTATPGGHVTATWRDAHGNVIRSLTAANRARALDDAPGDTPERESSLALDHSTEQVWSDDGQRLLSALAPRREVMLPSGTTVLGRTLTRNTYDQGAPSTGGPYHLLTTREEMVRHWGPTGVEVDTDKRTTSTAYDWSLRQPTATTADPGGLAHSVRSSYDPGTAVETSTTTAAGGTSTDTPATRRTVVYRATAGSGHPECDLRPEWANLPCRMQPGGQPADGPELPATVTTYDMFHQPRVLTERTSAAVLRTTTTRYDGAGREYETTVTGPAGSGTAVPAERKVYDPVTGLLVRTQSVSGGTVVAEIVRGYDTLGRLTSYTDADGNVSTTTYDLRSRVATSTDGRGTRVHTYDGGAERRGLLTSVHDSQAGRFTGSYDSDGTLVSETWPIGVVVSRQVDPSGEPIAVTYTRPGCAATDCTLFRESVDRSAHGQAREIVSTLSRRAYRYDQVGRLTQVQVTAGDACITRTYVFDAASNRRSGTEYGPAEDGGCQATSPAATQTWSYDTADRATTAGYAYDTLGRTTSVPAVDTANPAGGEVTVGYHVTDLVDTITQDGRSTDYRLDVDGERIRSWTDTAGAATVTAVHHYDGDEDAPAWTQENATDYTRPVTGLAELAGIWDSAAGTVGWQLTNLHGDVVATIHGDDTGLTTVGEASEYGSPADEIGERRYGWLGGKLRAADAPSGLVLMGVRLYNTATGRFLQVDPVYGGSCGRYEYTCADPANKLDLDGKRICVWKYCWNRSGGHGKTRWCGTCWLNHGAKKFYKFTNKWKKRGKSYGKACAYGAFGGVVVDSIKNRKAFRGKWRSWGYAGCFGFMYTKWSRGRW